MVNANEFVITERKCEMCKCYGPGATTKMVLSKGRVIAKLFTPCPNCGEDPNPITMDGRCGHCGKWICIKLENESPVRLGRYCIVCGEEFDLMGHGDNRTICPDCCEAIKVIKENSKRNWVAGSKGGEPNCRKV